MAGPPSTNTAIAPSTLCEPPTSRPGSPVSASTNPMSRPHTPVISDSTMRVTRSQSQLQRVRRDDENASQNDRIRQQTAEQLLTVERHRHVDEVTLRCTRGKSPVSEHSIEMNDELITMYTKSRKSRKQKKEAAERQKRLNVEARVMPIRSPPKESPATVEKKATRGRRATK